MARSCENPVVWVDLPRIGPATGRVIQSHYCQRHEHMKHPGAFRYVKEKGKNAPKCSIVSVEAKTLGEALIKAEQAGALFLGKK